MYKKRHNPPIYEEKDQTTEVFDRNNDAVIKTESLEQKTEQQETKPAVQKTKRGPLISKSMKEKGLIISLLLGIGFCTNEVIIKPVTERDNMLDVREKAIRMYADQDANGVITSQEEKDFDISVFKKHDAVTKTGNWWDVYYRSNGEDVDCKTLGEWYKKELPPN